LATNPEYVALVPETVCPPRLAFVSTYDPAPDDAVQLSMNPLADTLVKLSDVGASRMVETTPTWFDAPDVPLVLFAAIVNGPYDVAGDSPVSVYELGFVG